MLIISLFIIVSIVIIGYILWFIPETQAYIKKDLHKILVNAFVTFLAVFLAFGLSNWVQQCREIERYKKSFAALSWEVLFNNTSINTLRNNTREDRFDVSVLRTDIAESVLKNPYTYKYTKQGFIYALHAYLAHCQDLNSLLAVMQRQFETYASLMPAQVKKINLVLNDCQLYVYLLRIEIQRYVSEYGVGLEQEAHFEKLVNRLEKKEKVTIEQLKKELEELSNVAKSQTKTPRK